MEEIPLCPICKKGGTCDNIELHSTNWNIKNDDPEAFDLIKRIVKISRHFEEEI